MTNDAPESGWRPPPHTLTPRTVPPLRLPSLWSVEFFRLPNKKTPTSTIPEVIFTNFPEVYKDTNRDVENKVPYLYKNDFYYLLNTNELKVLDFVE